MATGISFKGLVDGSYVIVVPSGQIGDTAYTNRKHLDASSVGDSDWSEAYVADQTVDYNIFKLGYVPIRITGVVLSDFVLPVYINQVVDRAYIAPSGLAYGAGLLLDFSTTPWQIQVSVPTTVQNLYSYLLQLWSAATSVTNLDFPIFSTGVNSFSTAPAWEFSAASYAYLYDDGTRYSASGSLFSAHYAAIKSIGSVAGMQARAQLIDGTNPPFPVGDAQNQTSTGNVNSLIQIDGDATHGNFDSSGYLFIKYQENGYYQDGVKVNDIYGDLEDQLYVVALEPKPIPNFTLGDPGALSISIIYDPSPAMWNGATHKITIQDNGGYSGVQIQQYINYQLSQQNPINGIQAFNWPDMVFDNGEMFKTLRGDILGTSNNCGVKVVQSDGVTPHDDFSLFTADDGSTYIKPVTADIGITNLPNSGIQRLQLYNITTGAEYYNDDPDGAGYSTSYSNGVGISAGDSIRVRFAEINGAASFKFFSTVVISNTDGFSIDADNFIEEDSVYAANAINGATITKFAADFIDDEIDLLASSNFTASEAYAFFRSTLVTPQGINDFWGGVTAVDSGNYKINNSIVNIFFDNLTSVNLRQTDSARIFRADNAYPVKNNGVTSGGGGVHINWQNVVYTIETGSGMTAAQEAKIDAIQSKTKQLTFTKENELDSNIQSVNDVTLVGDGTTTPMGA